MTGLVIALALVPVIMAGALIALSAGFRAGDRPGDVTVTAAMGSVAQPDGRWPAVVATVSNPGAVAVLVGLSVRRRRVPELFGGGGSVIVPRRTTRNRLRSSRQAVVGVAGAGTTAVWTVPLASPGRSWRLVAVIGQADRRLRVIGVPVTACPPTSVTSGRFPTLSERDR
jgi:hypothetical protein